MLDQITIITGNPGKAREYSELLGMKVVAVAADLIEVQTLDVAEVVQHKARDAYDRVRTPVLVDDTGLALSGWNGLPGALITWFLSTVGPQGIVDMAASLKNRKAMATVALGYADERGVQVFTGSISGSIVPEPRGIHGFGYDSIFVPDGSDQTFAEMSSEHKNSLSHRRIAVEAFTAGLILN